MNGEIHSMIAACEWFPSTLLVFSENVYVPLIYYSHLGSLIPTLLIALFVYFHGKKERSNKMLLMTALFFAMWIFGDLVLWATEFPSYTMFFWSLLVLVEPFVYFFAFYFVFSFIHKRDLLLKQKLIFGAPLLITVLLTPTNWALLGFDLTNCDRAAIEGVAATYGYIVEILYVVLIWVFAIRALLHTPQKKARMQIALLSAGVSAFLLSFSLGNVLEVFTENWYIGQYGLFGAPIFVGLLAYLIVRYQAFSVRILGAQVLVTALWILVFSLLFVRTIESVRIVTSLTLIVVLILGIFLVRSVRKEVEAREELAKANERLKELDQLKTEFVSIASHQLRSPLTAISGYASMILEGSYGKVNGKANEAVRRIFDSCRSMIKSVEDFLNVSRIEQGRMKYEYTIFSLSTLVSKVVEDLTSVAADRGIALSFAEGVGDLRVRADSGKTRQIILNLIDNAVKYTPKGSVVVSLSCVGKNVRLAIRDTGVGMSEETKMRLFQKFSRAKDASKVNTGGTGLGLYVARQMATAQGGHIWAESPGVGKGSTFFLELPGIAC